MVYNLRQNFLNNIWNRDGSDSKGPAKSRHFFQNDHGHRVTTIPNRLNDHFQERERGENVGIDTKMAIKLCQWNNLKY